MDPCTHFISSAIPRRRASDIKLANPTNQRSTSCYVTQDRRRPSSHDAHCAVLTSAILTRDSNMTESNKHNIVVIGAGIIGESSTNIRFRKRLMLQVAVPRITSLDIPNSR